MCAHKQLIRGHPATMSYVYSCLLTYTQWIKLLAV